MGSPVNSLAGPNKVPVIGSLVNRFKKFFSDDPEIGGPPVFSTSSESRGMTQQQVTDSANEVPTLADQTYDAMRVDAGRLNAYMLYDQMEDNPIICAALDVVSEFATQGDDPRSETFNVQCDDMKTKKYITDKVKQLKLHDHSTPTAREVAKYGGGYWELIATPDGEITGVKPLPSDTMDRNETRTGTLKKNAFTQKDRSTNQVVATFSAWQIVHGRYTKKIGRMYGSSMLEPCRKPYKRLVVMEDGMVVQRTYRSHMRYAFGIPIDGMSVAQADAYLKKKQSDFKKKSRVNTAAGKPETYQAPIGASDDFFYGVRKDGTEAKIDTIQGEGSLGEIGDVEFFETELICAVGVPRGLLGIDASMTGRNSNLTEADVNFARRLYRMQQVMGDMVRETIRRCMIFDGMEPDAVEWTVVLPNISTVDDLRQAQIEALKATAALVWGQKMPIVDKEYIYREIMQIPAEEIDRLEALDPKELGIAPMPMPMAPGGDGSDGSGAPAFGRPGIAQSRTGLPASNPITAMRARMEWATKSDKDVVLAVRKQLGLPAGDDITEQEIAAAKMLRQVQEKYGGNAAISRRELAAAFSHNGHR